MGNWLFDLKKAFKNGSDIIILQNLIGSRNWFVFGKGEVPKRGVEYFLYKELNLTNLFSGSRQAVVFYSDHCNEYMLAELINRGSVNYEIWFELFKVLNSNIQQVSDFRHYILTVVDRALIENQSFQPIRHLITSKNKKPLFLSQQNSIPQGFWQTFDLINPVFFGFEKRLIIVGGDLLAQTVAALALECGFKVVLISPLQLFFNNFAVKNFSFYKLKSWDDLEALTPGRILAFNKQDTFLVTAPEATFSGAALAKLVSPGNFWITEKAAGIKKLQGLSNYIIPFDSYSFKDKSSLNRFSMKFIAHLLS